MILRGLVFLRAYLMISWLSVFVFVNVFIFPVPQATAIISAVEPVCCWFFFLCVPLWTRAPFPLLQHSGFLIKGFFPPPEKVWFLCALYWTSSCSMAARICSFLKCLSATRGEKNICQTGTELNLIQANSMSNEDGLQAWNKLDYH